MPVPVRRRARARRCRTVRGRDCCGFCAAKREQFFGWRRHLSCTTGRLHDLTPVHELPDGRRPAGGGGVYGDKGYNGEADEATILADTGVRLVPIRRANMRPNRWADTLALRAYRKRIEAPYRQLEALGVQRLRARTNPGRQRTLHASLLAATITNAD